MHVLWIRFVKWQVVPWFGSFHVHQAYPYCLRSWSLKLQWSVAINIHTPHILNGGVIGLAGRNKGTKDFLNCYGKYIRIFVDLSCLLLLSAGLPRVNCWWVARRNNTLCNVTITHAALFTDPYTLPCSISRYCLSLPSGSSFFYSDFQVLTVICNRNINNRYRRFLPHICASTWHLTPSRHFDVMMTSLYPSVPCKWVRYLIFI